MAASFPTSVKSFPTLVDLVDSVLASHQNDRALEIAAIETYHLGDTNTTVTTSDVTGAENKTYNMTIAGLTANRNLTLPVASAAGMYVTVNIIDGDDTYFIIIKGAATVTINGGSAATEFRRYQTKGTSITFRSTSTTNWQCVSEPLINDGWISVTGTWTYATANTINVPSGAASIYKKGMGIRWKQGGGYKYGYITVVADTLLTVTGGTDYTVANSAITDIAYTITPATAIGHPVTFNYTPTFSRSGTAFTNSPTVNSASFQLDGNLITGSINFTMPASAGGTGEIYASPPTTITTGMADFGIEIAATAAAFSIAASSSGQVFNFYDIYPVAVISTTSGRNYVGRFRYGI